ncbi:MAG: pentapeptide repeat-containing protein [Deltaproteobacteria bacterium]|nr:MAG: pentapeptide repeat-containing protein [Deltaproteobacteria bacterium]
MIIMRKDRKILANVDLKAEDFSETNTLKTIKNSKVVKSNFEMVNFPSLQVFDSNLSSSTFKKSRLSHCVISKSNLSKVDMEWTNFSHTNLIDTNFNQSNFQCATLENSELEKCKLEKADFRWSNLRGLRFVQCNLKEADLCDANMKDAKLINCNLKGARFNLNTVLPFSREAALNHGMIMVPLS